MRFTREPRTAVTVRSIGANGIRIGDETFTTCLVVTAERIVGEWAATPVADLTAGHVEGVLDEDPEVLILGTGSAHEFAPRELVFALARRSIGFEVMDSAAAARTFNVLAGEGRRVAAILYLPR